MATLYRWEQRLGVRSCGSALAIVGLAAGCSSSASSNGSASDGGGGKVCGSYLFDCACGETMPFGTSTPSCGPSSFPYPVECCTFPDRCECAAWVCGDLGGGTCRCDYGPGYDTTTNRPIGAMSIVSTCSGATCCEDSDLLLQQVSISQIEGSCICSNNGPCGQGTIQVDHCGADNPPLSCPGTGTQVASCQ